MKEELAVCAFTLLLSAVPLYARKVLADDYQKATVLRVEKTEAERPSTAGSNPSDAPLASRFYEYKVAVRVSCGTYVGHYESYLDHLPAAFTPNETVPVRVTKHSMYFKLPDRQVQMTILSRRLERGPCGSQEAMSYH
jgi:hypothetical protein